MKLDHYKITPSRIISGLLRVGVNDSSDFYEKLPERPKNEEVFKTVCTLRVKAILDNSGIGHFNPPNLAC